jgi:hypothetical protein
MRDSSFLSALPCGRPSFAQFLWAVLFSASSGISLVIVREPTRGPAVKWAAAIIPVVCGVILIGAVIRDMSKMDELQRRVFTEAAAVALLGVLVMGLVYPAFQRAGFVGPLSPPLVSLAALLLALLGYMNAWRRYR